MFVELLQVGRLQTNVTLLIDEETRKAILFDPGDDSSKIYAYIKDRDLVVSDIFITHHHPDHVEGVKGLLSKLEERPMIHMNQEEYELMVGRLGSLFTLDRVWGEGPIDLFNGIPAISIKVPGHTKASMCLYLPEAKLLVAGDTLFYHSIGNWYDQVTPGMNLEINIKEKLLCLPDDVRVIPGHGPTTSIYEEKTQNPYLSDADTEDPWL